MISKTIDISVTSVLQTTAGKMIFGRFDERVHHVYEKAPREVAAEKPAADHAQREKAPSTAQPAPDGLFRRGSYNRNSNYESLRHSARRGPGYPHGGGAAERAGTSRKQFMLLDGAPILLHTVRKFVRCPLVSEIVIALRAEDLEWVRELVRQRGIRQAGARGGRRRQPPAVGGERARGRGSGRPIWSRCTTRCGRSSSPTPSRRSSTKRRQRGAAIVGIVPVDTVKQVRGKKIRGTLPRERLVLAQTPQVFRYDLLKRAFAKAREDGFIGTDESSLVERLDEIEVSVVPGSDRNIKITKPTDMELARLFLKQEKAEPPAHERDANRTGLGRPPHRRRPAADPRRRHASPANSAWKATPTPTCSRTPSPTPCSAPLALGDIGMHFPDTDPRWKGVRHAGVSAARGPAGPRAGLRDS